MAIQRYKPTSPGRRGMSSQDFASITKGEPEKSLLETKNSSGGRNAYGRIDRPLPRRRPQAAATARSTSSARRPASRPRCSASSTTRTARPASRSSSTSMARRPTSWRRPSSAVGDEVISAQSADIKPGNCLPLRFIPIGTDIHAVELKIGARRAARPLGRRAHHADGQGGPLGHPAHALGRDAARARRLPRLDRHGRQLRARQHRVGQGGSPALAGPPAAQPRRVDEPGRSPDGWRRGALLGRPASLLAVGHADQGLQDAREQGARTSTSSAGAARKVER